MWKNCERRCTKLWTLLNGGDSTVHRSSTAGDSHKAWHPRSIAQTLHTVTIVSPLADRRDVNTHWIFCRRSTSGAKLSSWDQAHSQAVTFLGRTQTLRKWRTQNEPDKQHVPRSLKALGLTGVRCVAIPGTDDVGGNNVSELSKFCRTAKWHEPQKKLKRRRIPRLVKNCRRFRVSLPGKISLPWTGQTSCILRKI